MNVNLHRLTIFIIFDIICTRSIKSDYLTMHSNVFRLRVSDKVIGFDV